MGTGDRRGHEFRTSDVISVSSMLLIGIFVWGFVFGAIARSERAYYALLGHRGRHEEAVVDKAVVLICRVGWRNNGPPAVVEVRECRIDVLRRRGAHAAESGNVARSVRARRNRFGTWVIVTLGSGIEQRFNVHRRCWARIPEAWYERDAE